MWLSTIDNTLGLKCCVHWKGNRLGEYHYSLSPFPLRPKPTIHHTPSPDPLPAPLTLSVLLHFLMIYPLEKILLNFVITRWGIDIRISRMELLQEDGDNRVRRTVTRKDCRVVLVALPFFFALHAYTYFLYFPNLMP